ncbi:MAG: hypothetical protein SGI86_13955 [Deltaproteobacteria bacterium]|nr:hypothetical protein [Deltaproteobacteria bacterium]
MRTTIELADGQRTRLVELAARRGEKGFSRIIQEALEDFLRRQANPGVLEAALNSQGRLTAKEAEEFEASARRSLPSS